MEQQTASYSNPSCNQATKHYQRVRIQTADPIELILILCGGAVYHLKRATIFFEKGDIEQRVTAIDKAMAMIGELQAALDFDKGAEIATSLDLLYAYMLRRLTEANVTKDPQPVEEITKLLGILESAWRETRNSSTATTTSEG